MTHTDVHLGEDIKVAYYDGPDPDVESTAYATIVSLDPLEALGKNKHTGQPLRVRWDGERWTLIWVDPDWKMELW